MTVNVGTLVRCSLPNQDGACHPVLVRLNNDFQFNCPVACWWVSLSLKCVAIEHIYSSNTTDSNNAQSWFFSLSGWKTRVPSIYPDNKKGCINYAVCWLNYLVTVIPQDPCPVTITPSLHTRIVHKKITKTAP